jgi:hypothetical protein
MTEYVLPNNDQCRCHDNESLVGLDDKVPLWKVVQFPIPRLCKDASAVPKAALHVFKEVLETIQLATVDVTRTFTLQCTMSTDLVLLSQLRN